MAQQLMKDAFVAAQASAALDNSAEIDMLADAGIDTSAAFLGGSINDTGEVASVRPHGTNARQRVLAGAVSGTIALNYLSDDGNADFDPGAFWGAIWETPSRRFSYVIQPNRESLKANAGAPVIPGAAPGNPQTVGSAIMTGIDYWGPGDGSAPMVVNVTGALDRDFKRYYS